MVLFCLRYARATWSTSVLLPAPGEPVIPISMHCRCKETAPLAAQSIRRAIFDDEMARASARGLASANAVHEIRDVTCYAQLIRWSGTRRGRAG